MISHIIPVHVKADPTLHASNVSSPAKPTSDVRKPLLADRVELQNRPLTQADLRPGDVIFTHMKPTAASHKKIYIAQLLQKILIRLFGSSSRLRINAALMNPKFAHVSIYTGKPGVDLQTKPDFLRTAADKGKAFETAQVLRPSAKNMPLGNGIHTIYRPHDPSAANEMAALGTKWSDAKNNVQYNQRKSFLSVLLPSKFRNNAQKEYAEIRNDALTGKPSRQSREGVFCSEYGVNIINGAHSKLAPNGAPAVSLHAARTTPMELEAYLRHSDDFAPIGKLTHLTPTYRDLATLQKPKYHGELVDQLNSIPTYQALAALRESKPKTRDAIMHKLNAELQNMAAY